MSALISTLRRARHAKRVIALVTIASMLVSFLAPFGVAMRSASASVGEIPNREPDLASDGLAVPLSSSSAWAGQLASVDPATGAASLNYPFALPPARGGVQPTLGLTYSSLNGDGDAGVGWRLSGLPSIERRGPAGEPAPTYREPLIGLDWNTVDTFYFDGAPLVPICAARGARCNGEPVPLYAQAGWFEYRLLVDDGAALRFFYSLNHRTWVVQTKTETLQFGAPLDGKYGDAVDFEGPSDNVFRWRLARRADNRVQSPSPGATTFVNAIVYHWNGKTLSDIYYTPGANGAFESLALDEFETHVHLWWQRHPYSYTSPPVWRARTNALVTRVDVTTKNVSGTGARELTRLYRLRYSDRDKDWNHAKLAGVTEEGRCPDAVTEDPTRRLPEGDPGCPTLPEMTFEYSSPFPAPVVQEMTPAPDLYSNQQTHPRFVVFDANADGLPDALVTDIHERSSATSQRLLLNNRGQGFIPRNTTIPDGVRSLLIDGALNSALTADQLDPQALVAGDWYGDGLANLWGLWRDRRGGYVWQPSPRILPGGATGPSIAKFARASLDSKTLTWTASEGAYDFRIPGDADGILLGYGEPVDVNSDGLVDCLTWQGRWWGAGAGDAPDDDHVQRLPVGFALSARSRDGAITPPWGKGGPVAPPGSVGTGIPMVGAAPVVRPDGTKPPGVHPISDSMDAYLQRRDDRSDRPSGTRLGTWSYPFYFADIDGDGITDLIIPKHYTTSGELQFWRGHGDGWFGEDVCPPPSGQSTCSYVAGKPTLDINPPFFLDPDSNELFFHDVNGDGLADLLVRVEDGLHIHLNVGLPTWLDAAHEIVLSAGNPLLEWEVNKTQVGFADMNGNGTDDIVLTGHRFAYVELLNRTPNLLWQINNGLGATTTITYESSATMGANDLDDPRTHVPQPMQVVTRVETTNHLPGPNYVDDVVVYEYRNPVYDARAHAFRGFRNVTERHVGLGANSIAPGSVITRTFAIGACPTSTAQPCAEGVDNVYQAIRALPQLIETASDDTSVYHSTVHQMYEVRRLFNALDGKLVRLVYATQTDTFLYDQVPAPETSTPIAVQNFLIPSSDDHIKLDPEGDYVFVHATSGYAHLRSTLHLDDHGNPDVAVSLGRVSDFPTPLPSPDGDVPMTTTYDFGTSPVGPDGSWMWRAQGIKVSGGAQVRQRKVKYDQNGNVTDVWALLQGSEPLVRTHETQGAVAADPLTRSQNGLVRVYHADQPDIFGNSPHVERAGGRCTDIKYDDAFQHYGKSTTVFAGGSGTQGCGPTPLTAYATFDRGLGKPTSTHGVGGEVSASTYDAFGRIQAVYEPDPATPGLPSAVASLTFDYRPSPAEGLVRVATRSLYSVLPAPVTPTPGPPIGLYRTSYAISDALGQPLATFDEAEGTPETGKWVVHGRTTIAPSGRVLKSYVAAFTNDDPLTFRATASPTQRFESYTYDAFGRITRRKGLDGTDLGAVDYHALSRDVHDAEDLHDHGPHEKLPTSVMLDGFGRVKRTITRAHEDRGLAGNPLDETTTALGYGPTGEITSLKRTHSLDPNASFVRTMVYDTMGRMIRNYEPNTGTLQRASWQYAYDDAGNLVGTLDARGCGKNLHYDHADRLIAEDFSPCLAAQGPYTPSPSLTDGTRTEAFYRYDAPESDQSTTAAQAAMARGRLVSVADRGAHTRFAYDGRGRVVTTQRQLARPGADSEPVLANRYARSWFTTGTEYNITNRVSAQTTGAAALVDSGSNSSRVTVNYSARGLVDSVNSSHGTLVRSTRYDADRQPLAVQYGDAARTMASYAYESNNGLRQLSELSITRASGPWVSSPFYVPPSHADGTVQDVLVHDVFSNYDRVGNLIDIQDARRTSHDVGDWPSGFKPVDRHVDYDDNYRVSKVSYAHGGDLASAPLQGVTGAIPTIVPAAGRTQWQSFHYDWLGNIRQSSDDAAAFYDRSSGDHVPSPAAPNQISRAAAGESSIAPTYDAAGNIVSMVVQRDASRCPSANGCTHRFDYLWDEAGRLVRARRWDYVGKYPPQTPPYPASPPNPSADLIFAYDAANQRVLKSVSLGSSPTYTAEIFPSLRLEHAQWLGNDYQRDVHTEAPYLLAGGVALARVVYAERNWPSLSDSTLPASKLHVFLELSDHLGSNAAVIDHATGELVERVTYDAYGQEETDFQPARWAGFREAYRFTGKELDAEVGLTYFGQRYYCAALGQWVSPDPLAVHALGADLNPYAYVHGNVLGAIDPDGLDEYDPPVNTPGLVTSNDGRGTWSYVDKDGILNIGTWGPDHNPGSEVIVPAQTGEILKNYAYSGLDNLQGRGPYRGDGTLMSWSEIIFDKVTPAVGLGGGGGGAPTVGPSAVTAEGVVVGGGEAAVAVEAGPVGIVAMLAKALGFGRGHLGKPAAKGGGGGNRIGKNWQPRDISDPECATGCESAARQIQKQVGGDIRRITPNSAPTLGGYRGATPGWAYHDVVVSGGRVYDAFTGSSGATIDEFKALWEYADAINFGF